MISSRKFRSVIYAYYKKEGRHTLPWRKTHTPYRILVSEIMLQQTQVDRVVPKYKKFLKKFPTIAVLADATLGDVLRAWQGLGYNRRAKMLHECARCVMEEHNGRLPKTYDELRALPGVGPYTAGAVMAFAHNKPTVMIETNIRTVYLHHYFQHKKNINDAALIPLIELTLDKKHPREWYAALMDYGAHLKKTVGNASRKSAHHTKQSKFKGSDRQIRGAILRILLEIKTANVRTLAVMTNSDAKRVQLILTQLVRECLLEAQGPWFSIRNSETTA